MQNLKKILILFLLMFPQFIIVAGNNPSKEFNKEKWEQITEDLDYTEQADVEEDINQNDYNNLLKKNGDSGISFQWQLFLYILLGVWLFIALYYIIRKNLLAPKKKEINNKKFSVETIEENLHETDLDQFLRFALKENDFRLATRILFLMIIKKLSENQLINYKPDKTNRQYLRELKNFKFVDNFSRITNIYEHCWYGNVNVNEKNYAEIEGINKSFLLDIKDLRKAE
ncbi:MAG: hypothetical protein JXR58_02195 [Bacteroidales bacterium]|nr:hypothetical protein [Bacteroidales bacterium]